MRRSDGTAATLGSAGPRAGLPTGALAMLVLLAACSGDVTDDAASAGIGAPPSPSSVPAPAMRLIVLPLREGEAPGRSSREGYALQQVLELALRSEPDLLVSPLPRLALLELQGQGEELTRLGELRGVEAALDGRFDLADGQLRLDLFLRMTSDGRERARVERSGPADEPAKTTVAAAAELRRMLGLSPWPSGLADGLARALPDRLDDLADFAEGRRRLWLSDARSSRQLLAEVVEAAPEASYARLALAQALFVAGGSQRARQEAARAVELGGSLPPTSQLELQTVAAQIADDAVRLVSLQAELAARRPHDPEVWLGLARHRLAIADAGGAREALERAAALEPGNDDLVRIDLLAAGVAAAEEKPEERLALARRAAERASRARLELARAEARALVAEAELSLGDWQAAVTEAAAARQGFLTFSHRRQAATALAFEAIAHDEGGDAERARRLSHTALAELRDEGDARSVAATLNNLAVLELREKRLDAAAALFEEALEIRIATGDRRRAARLHSRLAEIDLARGQPERAEARYDEGIRVLRAAGANRDAALLLLEQARVKATRTRPAQALPVLRSALELVLPLREPGLDALVRSHLADVLLATGDVASAEQEQRAALQLYALASDESGANQARLALAGLALEGERVQEAEALANDALEQALRLGSDAQQALARAMLAWTAMEQGRERSATSQMALATELGGGLRDARLRLTLAVASGRLEGARGEHDAARRTLHAAADEAARQGYPAVALEGELALAEVERLAGADEAARAQLEMVAARAAAAGLDLIAAKARRELSASS